jgi:hypothetical protein
VATRATCAAAKMKKKKNEKKDIRDPRGRPDI